MAKGRLEKLAEELAHSLRRLDRDIARKAVGHDHIDSPCGNIVTFDEPVKMDRGQGIAQTGARLADGIVSLQILGAHIEQTDRRLDESEDRSSEDVAHQRELDKIF